MPLTRALNEHGVPTPRGSGFWTHTTAARVLWPCPGLTDTPDRLNALRGVDGGEQQTAPVLPGRIQARGGGGCPRWPLGFGGGGRVGPAGSAGPSLAALGGGPHGGRERCAGADARPAAGGAGTPRGPEPGGPSGGDRAAAA